MVFLRFVPVTKLIPDSDSATSFKYCFYCSTSRILSYQHHASAHPLLHGSSLRFSICITAYAGAVSKVSLFVFIPALKGFSAWSAKPCFHRDDAIFIFQCPCNPCCNYMIVDTGYLNTEKNMRTVFYSSHFFCLMSLSFISSTKRSGPRTFITGPNDSSFIRISRRSFLSYQIRTRYLLSSVFSASFL